MAEENNQNKNQEDSYRDEIEKFSQYARSKDVSLIQGFTLDELKKIISEYQMTQSHMDWYKQMEGRVKLLETPS